jgi:hypothetical protein
MTNTAKPVTPKPYRAKSRGRDASLQRRHFELIASIIQGLPAGEKQGVAEHFARHLYRTNASFKLDTFIGACLQVEKI